MGVLFLAKEIKEGFISCRGLTFSGLGVVLLQGKQGRWDEAALFQGLVLAVFTIRSL